MKKRVALALIVGAVILGRAATPRVVESTIPAAYYITPSLKTYETVIHCTGVVQSAQVRQIYLQFPVVAQDVFVSVGDVVKEGDILLRVDKEKSADTQLPLSLVWDVTEGESVSGGQGVDWASLASAYGLTASVSGGTSSADLGALAELLTQDSGSAANTTGVLLPEPLEEEIRAPIGGVVTRVDIQPQAPVPAGTAILTIADHQRFNVLASIREEDVGRVQEGDPVTVHGVGFPGNAYTGSITKIYPTARKVLTGAASETVVDAEISLDNPDHRLKSGFSAKVEIQGGNDVNLITVPYEAIRQDENNNEYVYLYKDGKLKKQIVVTGQELTSEVEILHGISSRSVVVYNPVGDIREGAMIQIKGRADVQ